MGLLVEEHISGEEGVLALDHLGAADILDLGKLGERDLRPVHAGNENTPEIVRVIPEFPEIPDPDRDNARGLRRSW